MTIAGHTFDSSGHCSCGMTKRRLRGYVYEFRAIGKCPIGEDHIAHTGSLNEPEWNGACAMVDAEDAAFDAALKDLCR